MRGSIILFLIVILVVSCGVAHYSPEEEDAEDIDDLGTDDDDDDDDDEDDDIHKKCDQCADFVGTNLFGDDGAVKKCFSSTDVALLMARKDFENLIPKDLPKCLLDDHLVDILIKYFYCANQVIVRMSNGNAKRIAEQAFYDTLGGYLKHYLIPVTKYSFYAGIVTLKTTLNVLKLLSQCKLFLNTNGNGWMAPICDFSEFELDIEPIKILRNPPDQKACQSACAYLNLEDDRSGDDDEMIVALPKLEPEEYGLLWNIWFPFKRKHTFNLRSHSSAFILLRYYVMVTRCYQFQGANQDMFHHKFKDWFQESIELHLNDDTLYPGLGAVLRIMETVRIRKKFAPTPHQEPKHEVSLSRECAPSKFSQKPSTEYIKLKNKADKLSDPSMENSVNTPLGAQSNIMDDFVVFDDDNPSVKARRKKYITIIVLFLLFLLVFILAVAVLTKYMSSKGTKTKKGKKKDKGSKGSKSGSDSPGSGKSRKKGDKKKDKDKKKEDREKKKHEKEEKKKHEKEDKKHEKEEKKHEKEQKAAEKKRARSKSPRKRSASPKKKGSRRLGGGSESSTSSSSSSSSSATPRSSRKETSSRTPRSTKGGLKLDLIDEKGRSKRFSISKKNKPTSSPNEMNSLQSMNTGGV